GKGDEKTATGRQYLLVHELGLRFAPDGRKGARLGLDGQQQVLFLRDDQHACELAHTFLGVLYWARGRVAVYSPLVSKIPEGRVVPAPAPTTLDKQPTRRLACFFRTLFKDQAMKSRAAVAFEAGKPLEIVELD